MSLGCRYDPEYCTVHYDGTCTGECWFEWECPHGADASDECDECLELVSAGKARLVFDEFGRVGIQDMLGNAIEMEEAR